MNGLKTHYASNFHNKISIPVKQSLALPIKAAGLPGHRFAVLCHELAVQKPLTAEDAACLRRDAELSLVQDA